MPAYVIYQCDVHDPAAYDDYKRLAAESVANAGGRYLARGGELTVLEGDPPVHRTVLLEFPSMAAARDWYEGAEYTAARRIRERAATATALLVDGVALEG